jgi:hypothetical protein
MSMPCYIEKALTKFQHEPPQCPQHSPHAWTAPTYGLFFLSSSPKTRPRHQIPTQQSHRPTTIHVHSSIMKSVLSSATEAETGALFYNAKEGQISNHTRRKGLPQPPNHIQTTLAPPVSPTTPSSNDDPRQLICNSTGSIKDRVAQGQFLVHWRRGVDNLADYSSNITLLLIPNLTEIWQRKLFKIDD